MPIRCTDPFQPPRSMADRSANPFVERFSEGVMRGSLPIMAGERLRGCRGRWRHYLSRPMGSLNLEIGCHKGNTLVSMAKHNPDAAFVGIDITYKRVVTTASRLTRAGLDNTAAVLAHARGLQQLFVPGEIDAVIVFFPDPWPKGRHEKNRLLRSEQFVGDLFSLVRPGGGIWLKTDSYQYFTELHAAFTRIGFKILPDKNRQGLFAQTHTSTFEGHFSALHQPIVDLVFNRP